MLPNCFSWEINSTLRPSLLHSCHHGLITDFHLTSPVCAEAWRTALDATGSIAPANPSPSPNSSSSAYNYVLNFPSSITCPGFDLRSKGYMAWLNTSLGSLSSPYQNSNVLPISAEHCDSQTPPPRFISPLQRFSHRQCKLGVTEQLGHPSGKEREWNSSVKINGGVRMDLSVGTLHVWLRYF